MTSGSCKGRQSRGEDQSEHHEDADCIRTCGDFSVHRERVQDPHREDQQRQNHDSDDHSYTSGDSVAVIIMDVLVTRFLSCFLSRTSAHTASGSSL